MPAKLVFSCVGPDSAFARLCTLLYATAGIDGSPQSLALLFWGSWAEKFGSPWPTACFFTEKLSFHGQFSLKPHFNFYTPSLYLAQGCNNTGSPWIKTHLSSWVKVSWVSVCVLCAPLKLCQSQCREKYMETLKTKFYCKTENATIHKCILNRGWCSVWYNILLRSVAFLIWLLFGMTKSIFNQSLLNQHYVEATESHFARVYLSVKKHQNITRLNERTPPASPAPPPLCWAGKRRSKQH